MIGAIALLFPILARRENVQCVTGTLINADGGVAVHGIARVAGLHDTRTSG